MFLSANTNITIQLQRLLLIAVAFIAITVIIAIYSDILFISSHYLYHTDFFKFYQSVRFYFSGQHIYDKITYPLNDYEISIWHSKVLELNSNLNPPFLTLLLLPTAWLSYSTALLDWFTLSIIFTFVSILLILKTYTPVWQNTSARYWALAGLILYFPNYLNLYIGQLTSLLLILTTVAWLACKDKKDGLAGTLLGLAVSIKLFYGLFFILFAARKQWRALCFMLATFVICTASALWVFGIKTYQNYLINLKQIYWYSSNWNASLLGFLTRLFGGNHQGNHPLFNWPQLTHPLYLVLSSVIILYFIYTVISISNHTNIHNDNQIELQLKDRFDWQFSMTIVLMLFLSPLGWIYYFPLLIIPFVTILRLSNTMNDFNLHFIFLNIIIIFSSIPSHYRFPMEIIQPIMVLTWGSYYSYALMLLIGLLLHLKQQLYSQQHNKINCLNYAYANHSQQLSLRLQILIIVISSIPSLLAFGVAIQNCLT